MDYNTGGTAELVALQTALQAEMHDIFANIINGANYNSTLLAATSTGSAIERWIIPMSANNYDAHAWAGDEQATKHCYMKAVQANNVHLTGAGMAANEAAVVSILRATSIARHDFPATAALAGVPVLDATFQPTGATIQELRDPYILVCTSAKTIYANIALIANDYVNYLHLAHYFRKTEIHLTSNTTAYIRKFNQMAVAVRGAAGQPGIMLLTIPMFRAFGHAFGFVGLVAACNASSAQCATVLQQRQNCVCAGSALVPTICATLEALTASMIVIPPQFALILQRLQAATAQIALAPTTYAVHFKFYHQAQQVQAQMPEQALAKQVAPMLAGWVKSLGAGSTLKSQKVITRNAQSNPEDVELWERLFTAHRRNISTTADLAGQLLALGQTIIP